MPSVVHGQRHGQRAGGLKQPRAGSAELRQLGSRQHYDRLRSATELCCWVPVRFAAATLVTAGLHMLSFAPLCSDCRGLPVRPNTPSLPAQIVIGGPPPAGTCSPKKSVSSSRWPLSSSPERASRRGRRPSTGDGSMKLRSSSTESGPRSHQRQRPGARLGGARPRTANGNYNEIYVGSPMGVF